MHENVTQTMKIMGLRGRKGNKMKKRFMAGVMCLMILLCSSCQQKTMEPLEVPSKKVKTKTFSNDQFSFEYPSKLNVDTVGDDIFLSYSGLEEDAIMVVVNNQERNFNLLALQSEVKKTTKSMAMTYKQLGMSVETKLASIPAGNVLVVYTNTDQQVFDGNDKIDIFFPNRERKMSIHFVAEGDGDNYEQQKQILLVIANSFKFNEQSK